MIGNISLNPTSITSLHSKDPIKMPSLTQRVTEAVCHFFATISDIVSTAYKSLKNWLITKEPPLSEEKKDQFFDALPCCTECAKISSNAPANPKDIFVTNRNQLVSFLNKNLKNKILIKTLKDKLLPSNIQSFEVKPDGSSFILTFDKEYKAQNIQVSQKGLTALNGANFIIQPKVEGSISNNNSIQTITLNSNHLVFSKTMGFLPIKSSLTSVKIDNNLNALNQKSITIQTGNKILNKTLQCHPISSTQLEETFKNLKWT